jgi:hypothetical protein
MKTLTGRQRSFQMLKQFTKLKRCKTLLLVTLMLLLQQLQFLPLHLKGVILHKGDIAQLGQH